MKKKKQPWPTQKVMVQIYDQNLWGGEKEEYYSGDGSHNKELVDPYVSVVANFLTSHNPPLIVCDLGCGDFNVGRQLVQHTAKYFGVDIVPKLIAQNKKRFQEANTTFHCLDISADELPDADCVIVRQVLQHLSNSEILRILNNLSKYKYVLITEHIPSTAFTPNIDIISGQGIRLKKKSGVDITAEPFLFPFQKKSILHRYDLGDKKGQIVTTLFELF